MLIRTLKIAAAGLLASASLLALTPHDAQAFCGFYVSGADQEMYNNATMVVMMREGTKTVLSMRNNYEGPPEGFAMVIPVPQVLEEENVKVLSDDIFTRVDSLAAPRLVEYWEQDPCMPQVEYEDSMVMESGTAPTDDYFGSDGADLGVKIEAQFDVGEYNVVILSAKESNGLQTWLEQEKYNIPAGAAPVLKPYIEGGQYFFVAKVDPKKVTFKDGQAMLSPLRFHYDSKDFSLPVRLGLLNAKGHQDLLVHILARGQRYEVANYPNVTIPTNILVKQHVRSSFGEFYATLLDRTMEESPGAVITEYAWDASSCDPCPTPALNYSEIYTLGADVLSGDSAVAAPMPKGRSSRRPPPIRRPSPRGFQGYVLTRMHARYTAKDLKEDLVFKQAGPIIGGRGTPSGRNPRMMEEGSSTGSINNFQGRYIMLNRWEGKITCDAPNYGVWGGPSGEDDAPKTTPAKDTAFVQRGKFKLAAAFDQESVPGLKLTGAPAPAAEAPAKVTAPDEQPDTQSTPAAGAATQAESKPGAKKTGCSATGSSPAAPAPWLALGLLGMLGLFRRTRRS